MRGARFAQQRTPRKDAGQAWSKPMTLTLGRLRIGKSAAEVRDRLVKFIDNDDGIIIVKSAGQARGALYHNSLCTVA